MLVLRRRDEVAKELQAKYEEDDPNADEASGSDGSSDESPDESSLASDAGVLLVDTDENSDPIEIGNNKRKRLRKNEASGSDDSSDKDSDESSMVASDIGSDIPRSDESSLASNAGTLLVDTDENFDPIETGNNKRKRLRKRYM